MTKSSETVVYLNAGRLFREISLAFFKEHVQPRTRVLDCGAGDGDVSIPLAEQGCIVDAIDLNAERIANIKAGARDLPVNGVVGDFFTHPFTPESYDFVIARQFVAHFPDRWSDVLERMVSFTKPGGAVVFHIHSAESARVSRELALGKTRRSAVERGYPMNGAITVPQLEAFAREHGLTVEQIRPVTIFHSKALFYRAGLNKPERLEFGAELDRRLANPEVYEFARWFETEIMGRMPPGFAADVMVVLRRS